MPDSFTLLDALHPTRPVRDGKLKVLVTGAAGRIGSYFAMHSESRFDLRLLCLEGEATGDIDGVGEIQFGDITNLDDCKQACDGIDVVLHLAADPSPTATWDVVQRVNIGGTYNVFAAAKAEGVRRVVYASSIHAVSGYPRGQQVHASQPVNPGDLYGVSKCFGEALGRYMAEQEGLQCIAVRIGAFQPPETAEQPDKLGLIDGFVSKRDLNQLLQKAIEAEHLRWAVVQALSDNAFNFMDITDARWLLDYEPEDDFTKLNPELRHLHLHKQLVSHNLSQQGESGLRNDV